MLRILIDQYLEGTAPLSVIEVYLVENLQNILDSKDQNKINSFNRVDANLIAFGEGIIDESRLMRRLFRERKILKDVYYWDTSEGHSIVYNYDFTN